MTSTPIHVRAFAVFALMCFTHATHADNPYSGEPGSLDLLFGGWGMGLATSRDVEGSYATAIDVDSLNRIVVGGNACIDAYCGPLLMRFDSTGKLDTSGEWGEDGAVLLAASPPLDDYAAVRIAPADNNGWWVTWQDFTRNEFHVQHIDSEGRFAPGFAPGDVVEQLVQAADNVGLHRIEDNGTEKLISVVPTFGFTTEVIVTRRNADGSPDGGFGDDGRVLIPISGDDTVRSSALLADGRIAVLLMDYGAGRAFVHVLEPDGSTSADFGASGVVELNAVLADAFDALGISGEHVETAGMGVHPDGHLLFGVSVCCDDDFRFRAGVAALDEKGALDVGFGGGSGAVLHPDADDYVSSIGFAVDSRSGSSVHHVWMLSDAFDSMLHFTDDGRVDETYTDGSARNLQFPGSNGIANWAGTLAHDTNGGVLLAFDNFGPASSILGLDGFGVARFLAPGETRTYDTEPDEIEDFTWPSAPKFSVMGLLLTDFGGRDVAINASITNGRIGLATDGEDDYTFLSSEMIVPVDMVAQMLHLTASTPETRTESHVSAGTGPMEFILASETGADRSPQTLIFDPVENAAPGTFVFSTPAGLWGVDVPIDISVENGCYFLFDSFDELPDDFNDWPDVLTPENCRTEPGTATAGQVVFLGHVSADTPETVKTTTFRYGLGVSTFRSTTAAASPPPPDNEPDDFTVPNIADAELDQDVVIGPIALTGFDAAFVIGDTMNEETARIEVSTDGESWMGAVEISPGDALWLRVRSADTPATVLTGELYVGSTDNRKTFTVTTRVADPGGPNEPPVPDDPDNSDSGGGPLGPLLLSALLAVPLLRRSR